MTNTILIVLVGSLAHLGLMRAAAGICGVFFGFGVRVLRKIRKDQWQPSNWFLGSGELIPLGALSLVGLGALASSAADEWLAFWTSSAVVAAGLVVMVWSGLLTGSSMAMARQQAAFFRWLSIPLGGLMVVKGFIDDLTQQETYRYSAGIGYLLAVITTLIGIRMTTRGFRVFFAYRESYEQTSHGLAEMAALVQVVPDSETRRAAESALRQGNQAVEVSQAALASGEEQPAEAALIHAERELVFLRSILTEDLRENLPKSLALRHRSAEQDLKSLERQFLASGLATDLLEETTISIKKMATQLGDVPQNIGEIPQWLSVFAESFLSIENLRSMLRILDNSGSIIETINSQLADGERMKSLAALLGIDYSAVTKAGQVLRERLQEIQKGTVESGIKLSVLLQDLQSSSQVLRHALADLDAKIGRGWQAVGLASDLLVFVPRWCTTHQSARGAVEELVDGYEEEAELVLNGTLLELGVEPSIRIPLDGARFHGFQFVGKRAGRGVLSLKLTRTTAPIASSLADVRILRSPVEALRDSAFAAPVGGLAVTLLAWTNGWELKEATQAGALGGAAFAGVVLLIFLIASRKNR